MKGSSTNKYLLIGIGIIILISLTYGLIATSEKKNSWVENYIKTSKEPYGTYLLYEMIDEIFETDSITESNKEIFDQLVYESYDNTNYIIINDFFYADESDMDEILRFVREGNHLFIAAKKFSEEVEERLSFKIKSAQSQKRDSIQIQFTNSIESSETYTFPKKRMAAYFESVDYRKAELLAKTVDGQSKFIRYTIGDGSILLSTDPVAMTNYFMVHKENHEFVSSMLSYMPNENDLIWDEYYKVWNLRRNQYKRKGGRNKVSPGDENDQETAFGYIMKQESLRWGLLVIIFSLLLYAIFEAKRTQRIIPVKKPLPNTTLDFTETVGRLYYQQTDHKKVASKKIKIFLQYIRSNYFLKTQEFSLEFIDILSGKSGIEPGKTRQLFRLINRVQTKLTITEEELIELTNYIDQFYQEGAR